ncbi:MAG TPA: metalloprotease PmbA [Succinivibrionaceae bacterium]|nr:metalloprotease PmbA [Succinivibrionaceae bacterium]
MDFFTDIKEREQRLQHIANEAVSKALSAGADSCAAVSASAQGISVSSRDGEVENLEFNRDNELSITVYKNNRRGSASTTDLSPEALEQTATAAVALAEFSDEDDCAGLPDADLLCKEFRDLKVLYPGFNSPDDAVKLAVDLDRYGLSFKTDGIKGSDGSSADYSVYTNCLANSSGFCRASSSSICSAGLTLLGEKDGKMQRGSGFTVARDPLKMHQLAEVADEAYKKTTGKLGAVSVKTGKYNVIFSRSAVQSLLGNFAQAISGNAIYRRGSFLCDFLGKKVMPQYVSLLEDPFIEGSFGAANCDGEGVRVNKSLLIKDGILQDYLLSSYSARKLKMRTNGHSGGIYNWFLNFDESHTRSFDDLLKDAGEGLVIDELMGQGVDLASGNYSRGAAGYYFKNGKREYAVSEITVAGNLKDMFLNMALIGNDVDKRYKVQTGSILIPEITVSGS